jgi:hypothetical protein
MASLVFNDGTDKDSWCPISAVNPYYRQTIYLKQPLVCTNPDLSLVVLIDGTNKLVRGAFSSWIAFKMPVPESD